METSSALLSRLHNLQDSESWNEFVSIYEPLIIRYALSLKLSEFEAFDVAQDVFSRILRVFTTFQLDRTRGKFRSWLWRVTMSAAADRLRREGRRNAAEQLWREQFCVPSDRTQWERDVRRKILDDALMKVRGTSARQTWSCFERHVLECIPAADVASELGVSCNTVYVNASRVLSRVRALCALCLEDLSDEPENLPEGARASSDGVWRDF